MAFNYSNLWLILDQKDMTKDDLRKLIQASPNTIVKLNNNEPVSLDIIGRICEKLKCTPNDIINYIPDEEPIYSKSVYKKGDIFVQEFVVRQRNIKEPDFKGERQHVSIPCLIYQNNILVASTNSVMVIPFTSRVDLQPASTDVVFMPDEYNGFLNPVTLKIAQMRSIPRVALTEKRGYLSEENMIIVDRACSVFLGIDNNN